MTAMTLVDAAGTLVDAGALNYGGGWVVVTFTAIGVAEARVPMSNPPLIDPWATHRNTHDPLAASYLSLDLGWLMINDFYAAALLRQMLGSAVLSQALANPRVCAEVALEIFRLAGGQSGGGYRRWNTWLAGKHVPFLSAARMAARTIGLPV